MARSTVGSLLRMLAPAMVLLLLVLGAARPAPAAAAAADVRTIRQFDTSTQVVALTFDAGSDRGNAARILDILSARSIHATFGMTGRWAEQNPDLLQRIVREGHPMLNHSWDHPVFPDLTTQQRREQLKRTEDTVRAISGAELRPYFRPPYGEYDNATLADLADAGYTYNIMWSIDTLGWQGLTAAQINERVFSRVQPGSIILMHVGAESQDAAALPAMIDQLRARGYTFATIPDLVNGIPTERYFPETGHWVRGNFLRFWNDFGGLPNFGYPLSDVLEENGMQVQYFERVRMEWQPGVWPEHHDILLGLLGVSYAAGHEHDAPFRPRPGASNANCTYYPQTGHYLCFGFRDWWNQRGGLTIFGYPISEELSENGRTVQYFERARLEWHPENKPPWNVLGTHLGRWAWEQRGQ